jgi:GDP-4-dehydro-6-deoxy-D-mannose reductase
VRALVTGASGFVGRHLVAHLLACGDNVLATDHNPANRTGAGHVPLDVTDVAALARLLSETTIDTVYHLAARSHVGQSWADDDVLTRVNVGGTQAVVDASAAAQVARVLVVGSAEQYGPVPATSGPVDERVPMHPLSPYGVSKLAAESAALDAWRRDGAPVVCVRAFNHTGPGQSPAFFVPGFAGRIARAERDPGAGDEIAVGNLESVRDFTDVRDVVRAYRLLVERGTPGEAYNVCSGEGVQIGDLAARLLARARRPLHLRVDPDLVRPVEVPVFVGDASKLVAATGWARVVPLDTTLDDVLAEARAGVAAAAQEKPSGMGGSVP